MQQLLPEGLAECKECLRRPSAQNPVPLAFSCRVGNVSISGPKMGLQFSDFSRSEEALFSTAALIMTDVHAVGECLFRRRACSSTARVSDVGWDPYMRCGFSRRDPTMNAGKFHCVDAQYGSLLLKHFGLYSTVFLVALI